MEVRNSKGLTLVEVLASVAILSIIMILIGSTQIFGQKQYVNQHESVENQTNVRLATKLITKDIRSNGKVEIINSNSYRIGPNSYKLEDKTIYKNDQPLVIGIQEFNINFGDSEKAISLLIKSVPNKQNKSAQVSTVIMIRE